MIVVLMGVLVNVEKVNVATVLKKARGALRLDMS